MNELIDGFIDDPEIDFVQRFSTPFPSQVFLTMFGLPMADLDTFLAMKDGAIRPDQVVGQPLGHPETEAHQQRTADSIYAYFERVIAERGRRPRPTTCSARFLDAEVDGERLSHEEILDICFLFLIAGLDTVTASLDCMFTHLAEHPEHRQRLIDDPEAIRAIVEELLRWETPVMGGARVATRDTEVDGFEIAAGEQVMVLFGARQRRRRGDRLPDGARLGPRGQPPPGLRRRHPPLPRFAPGPHRAPGGPDRVAPPDPRVLGRPGRRARRSPPASAPSTGSR